MFSWDVYILCFVFLMLPGEALDPDVKGTKLLLSCTISMYKYSFESPFFAHGMCFFYMYIYI